MPDELQTGQTTEFYQNDLMRQNPSLFSIQPAQLDLIEQEHYESELKYMQTRIVIQNELQNKIDSALKIMSAEVDVKKQKNEFIDYHFYNRVLTDLSKIVSQPHDKAAIQHLGTLAEVAAGTPQLGKKIAGALMAIVGLALIAASIACLVATFGGSSLASGFGVALGLSLLQSQITLGISASLAALGGIGLSFWGGVKFRERQRQGLSKELEDVKEECLHPTLA